MISLRFLWLVLLTWAVMDCTFGSWIFHDDIAQELTKEFERAWFVAWAQLSWWFLRKSWEEK